MQNNTWADQWEKICGLWDTWVPSDEESRIWRMALGGYDGALLDKGRRAYYRQGARYRRPDLGKFEEAVKQVARDTHISSSTETKEFHIAFICQEAGRKPIGFFEMFSWVAHRDSYGGWAVPSQEHLNKVLWEKYTVHFGGRWVSMLCENANEVRTKAREFGKGAQASPGDDTEDEAPVGQPDQIGGLLDG